MGTNHIQGVGGGQVGAMFAKDSQEYSKVVLAFSSITFKSPFAINQSEGRQVRHDELTMIQISEHVQHDTNLVDSAFKLKGNVASA